MYILHVKKYFFYLKEKTKQERKEFRDSSKNIQTFFLLFFHRNLIDNLKISVYSN